MMRLYLGRCLALATLAFPAVALGFNWSMRKPSGSLTRVVAQDIMSNFDIKAPSSRSMANTVDSAAPPSDEYVDKPEFCHGLDCPRYKLLNKTANYELRQYDASHWVSTHLQKIAYDEATSPMFRKLFNYIEGENQKKEKIAMTAPVLTKASPGAGPACKQDFVMSFYMAPKVTNPPAPSDKTVYFSSLPKQNVFVASFGGRAYESDWLKHATELAETLVKDKQKFNKDFFYTAGYDSPFRLLFRHNEVWFVAEE